MKTALVTGASSGIGATFARQLASRDYNLVLVARSHNKLQQLAQQLEKDHSIYTVVIPQDLTQPKAAQTLFDTVTAKGVNIDLLINNAGFCDYGLFADSSLTRQLEMIQLNISALVALTHLFLRPMRQQGEGGIINVSSIAGFQPIPYLSIYAATKAFVLNFSEAIWEENQDASITVTCVCPGPTETEFFMKANFPNSVTESSQHNYTSPEEVVQAALNAFWHKQASIVPGGLGNQLIANLGRFLPRETLVKAVANQFRPNPH